jgi:hypothetical protein
VATLLPVVVVLPEEKEEEDGYHKPIMKRRDQVYACKGAGKIVLQKECWLPGCVWDVKEDAVGKYHYLVTLDYPDQGLGEVLDEDWVVKKDDYEMRIANLKFKKRYVTLATFYPPNESPCQSVYSDSEDASSVTASIHHPSAVKNRKEAQAQGCKLLD